MEECDLIFDLELSNEDDQRLESGVNAQTALDGSLVELARMQQRPFVKKLLEQVKNHNSFLMESNFPRRLVKLGQSLSTAGYHVVLRSRHGGGETRRDCLKNVPHVHLVVKERPSHGEIIVETAFRSHFSIPWASEAYNETLRKIPEVFVGDRGVLGEIAKFMNDEMAKMFTKMKRIIPPWRCKESILLKWAVQGSYDKELKDLAFCHNSKVPDPKCSSHWTWPEFHHGRLIPAGINPIVGFF
ncbi:hypothetical protein BSKO_03942 [Bryopsis sp. KO-2023]|nr:hypothetical protein BSKO_03942 [Bryopsis sp. KO-2023]